MNRTAQLAFCIIMTAILIYVGLNTERKLANAVTKMAKQHAKIIDDRIKKLKPCK